MGRVRLDSKRPLSYRRLVCTLPPRRKAGGICDASLELLRSCKVLVAGATPVCARSACAAAAMPGCAIACGEARKVAAADPASLFSKCLIAC
jgi:hypothetical protein